MDSKFDYKIDLREKNILVIMPHFYSYQAMMRDDIISRGANVKFYDEEPERAKYLILKKFEKLFRIKNIFEGFNKGLVDKIIKEMPSERYDYLLVIRGNVLTDKSISKIKQIALKPNAKTIYYAWDSFENMRHKGELGRLFDYRATFDSVDASNNNDYDLLPLFYSDAFDGSKIKNTGEYKYDYASISAYFPFRYRYFRAFKQANSDKRLYLKLYLSPSVYKGKRLLNPGQMKNLDMDIVSFTPFAPEEIRDICLQSKAVLDLASENQQGLTMRTMETLGLRRKLVTNNIYLRDYEFYNDNNAFILENLLDKADAAEQSGDYSAFELPNSKWLDNPYVENEDMRGKYSIHSWIDSLFGQSTNTMG